jgi:hypothetical protein
MARAREIFRRSKKSTTGESKQAATAASAIGHKTGLIISGRRASPQMPAVTSPMTIAAADPVKVNHRICL